MLKAVSKSAIMSSISSIPTEMRTRSGVTPASSCSSAVSCAWVLEAGWMTSVLASPVGKICKVSAGTVRNLSTDPSCGVSYGPGIGQGIGVRAGSLGGEGG